MPLLSIGRFHCAILQLPPPFTLQSGSSRFQRSQCPYRTHHSMFPTRSSTGRCRVAKQCAMTLTSSRPSSLAHLIALNVAGSISSIWPTLYRQPTFKERPERVPRVRGYMSSEIHPRHFVLNEILTTTLDTPNQACARR